MPSVFSKIFLPAGKDPTDPKTRARAGKLCGVLGIGANIGLFGAKLFIGMLSGSVSITADAMNNLADASSSVVTLLGFRLAQQPADEDHPYGHARYEYLSGLAVAAMIIVIGFELAKSSVQKILSPTPVQFSWPLVAVLVLSILVKLWLSHFNRYMSKLIDSAALAATAADSRNDVIATGAVLLAALIENYLQIRVDGFFGLAVALFILYSGANMAKETISPLLGENASPELRRRIAETVGSHPMVLGYHDLMVHDYGPGQRFATMHVEMDQNADPLLCHEVIDNLERTCLRNLNVHLVLHYDPMVVDDPEVDVTKEKVTRLLAAFDPDLSFHDFRMVRGTGHTNLIFDIVLSRRLRSREKEILEHINNGLNQDPEHTYYTVITFDFDAFNLE
jgi:cation diffusion facilitator family transporter